MCADEKERDAAAAGHHPDNALLLTDHHLLMRVKSIDENLLMLLPLFAKHAYAISESIWDLILLGTVSKKVWIYDWI